MPKEDPPESQTPSTEAPPKTPGSEWFGKKVEWLRRKLTSSFWTALATAVIAGATILYTCYANQQWQAMSKQVEVTSKQLEVMSKQLEADQRPWLYVKELFSQPDGLNPRVTKLFTANIANSGKTPAILRYRLFTIWWGAGGFPEDPTANGLGIPNPSVNIVVFPGSSNPLEVVTSITFGTEEEVAKIKSGQSDLYVYGKLVYSAPGSSVNHETRFCYRILPEVPTQTYPFLKQYESCRGRYNYAD